MKHVKILISCFLLCIIKLHSTGWGQSIVLNESSTQMSQSSCFSNRNGVYSLHINGGSGANALRFSRYDYTGINIISSTNIDATVLMSAVITGDENNLFVVYAKSTTLYIKQSTNFGSSWSSLNSVTFPSGDNTIFGIEAVYISSGNYPGLYMVYSTSDGGDHPKVNFYRYNGGWTEYQNVTDESGMFGRAPSIAINGSKVFVSFSKSTASDNSGQTRVRERQLNSTIWEATSYDISPQTNFGGASNIYVDNNYLNALVFNQLNFSLYHYKRNLSNGTFSQTKIAENVSTYRSAKLAKTFDGNLYATYVIYDVNPFMQIQVQKYDGSSWNIDDQFAIGYVDSEEANATAVGNDLYVYGLYLRDIDQTYAVVAKRYDGLPISPTAMSIGSPNQVTVNWSWNPEPDINNYEVWRKYYRSRFDNQDWTLMASPTTNSWTDPDFQLNSMGDHYTVYYKTRSKDKTNQLSGYSSEISTDAVMVFSKKGNLTEQVAPTQYNLEQNYPNPFNPTTNIDYSIPEQSSVTIKVFDHIGREVVSLVNREQATGFYSTTFDASKLSSGVYFYKIVAGRFTSTKKMLLMK